MLRTLVLLLLTAGSAFAGPFEPTLVARVGSDRFRFPGDVQDLVVSPDGRRLMAISPTEVRVYDTATGRPLGQWRSLPDREIYAAALSTDGFLTFGQSAAGKFVIRHHGLTNRPAPEVAVELPDFGDFVFSPDGLLLAVVGEKQVTLFDTHTGREVNRIPMPRRGGDAYKVRFSADGRRVAVMNHHHNTVRVYDRTTGRELAALKAKRIIKLFALSPDGNRVSAALDGDSVATLNVLTGVGRTWKATEALDELFDLGGDRVMTVDIAASKFQVFDAATGRVVRRFQAPAGSETGLLTGTVVGPDGRTLFSVSGEGGITAWDVTTNRKLPQSADAAAVESVVRFHGANRVGFAPRKGSVGELSAPAALWDVATGRLLAGGPADDFSDLSPSGLWRVAYTSDRVAVTNTATGKVARTLPLPPDAQVQAVWFRDGDRQVCVEATDTVFVWNLATNHSYRVDVAPHQNYLPSLPSGGRWFAAWVKVPTEELDHETTLRVYDLDGGRAVFDLPGRTGDQLLFTPDGSRLIRVRGGQDPEASVEAALRSTVELYDSTTGRLIRTVTAVGWELRAASPDGRTLLISTSRDTDGSRVSTLAAVELATGRERWNVPAVKDWFLHGAGFAPDGRRVAVGTSDGFIRVWDSSGDRPATLDALAAARLWDDLAGPDAGKAFSAVAALSHAPDAAVSLLRAKVAPAAAVDAKAVGGWLRDLDSPVFAVRRDATRNLRAASTAVRPALEALLKTTPSPEVRERLTALLASAASPTPAEVRAIRAVETLERIATAPAATAAGRAGAVELLRAWATGAAGATLTAEATESLSRVTP